MAQRKTPTDGTDAVKRATGQIDAVDQQVKTGNAESAEVALSGAVAAVKDLTYSAANTSAATKNTANYGTVDLSA